MMEASGGRKSGIVNGGVMSCPLPFGPKEKGY